MIEIKGKNGISAKIIADSSSASGKRMITMELVFPRPILSELNTHRMLSKNSQSSRAVPLKSAIQYVTENPFIPVWWGKNQPGMSAKEELDEYEKGRAKHLWLALRDTIAQYVQQMGDINLHKQIAARPLEAFQMHKAVVSGTEWENLLWLRDHEDAQPEFGELAKCITEAINTSEPVVLHPGEWHLPYVDTKIVVNTDNPNDERVAYFSGDVEIPLDIAQKVSASCCAQVSYRKLDDSVEKAVSIFEKLFSGTRPHCSPVEHQATPMLEYQDDEWETGITHIDRNGNYWSGNLQGWIQYRKLIPNEAKW